MSLRCALCVSLLLLSLDACDIKVTLKTETFKTVFAQFTFFNGNLSEKYKMEDPKNVEKLTIKGGICGLKPTHLKTYDEEGKLLGTSSAFIDGNGNIVYHINSDRTPHMGSRFGILCSFGDCGAGQRG